MKTRKLGELTVSAEGLGCMSMSEYYGPANHGAGLKTIKRALALGVNFFDTADIYGHGANEALLAEAFRDIPRQSVIIATKCGIVRDKNDPTRRAINTSPEYIKQCCDDSLKRLKADYIDLFYLHRLDNKTPIEESMHALKELVAAGKIKHIGLCEVDEATIRRAHHIHPLTAIQSEYSLWCREPEAIFPICRELNIGFVAYSPIGRGFFSGEINASTQFAKDDFRFYGPRFSGENIQTNLNAVDYIKQLANEKNVTPAELAIAWVLAQGEHIVPIPGTTKVKHLESNIGALQIQFTDNELPYLNDLMKKVEIKGERYPVELLKATQQQ